MRRGPERLSPSTTKTTTPTRSDPSRLQSFASQTIELQRLVGNHAVTGLLQRLWPFSTPTDQEFYDTAVEEKGKFRANGPYGPTDYRPSTGFGGFEAKYDAIGSTLAITLRGGVDFRDSIELQDGAAVAKSGDAKVAAAVTAINKMPLDKRAAAVAQFQWNSAEKEPWTQRYESQIQSVWSSKFQLHVERKYWEDVGANVNVVVSVTEHIDSKKAGDDHMELVAYKASPGFVGEYGSVDPGIGLGGSGWGSGATNNTMTIYSSDVEGRTDNSLNASVKFQAGSENIDPSATGKLDMLAIRFKSGTGAGCQLCGAAIPGTDAPIELSVPGAPELAEKRATKIKAALTSRGLAASRLTTVLVGGTGDDCALKVGNGVAQIVAAHEAGHMFGLGDEYGTDKGGGTGGTGGDAGEKTEHHDLAQSAGVAGSVFENNDNIMSSGNVVRPQHYSTFVEAINVITSLYDWKVGAPKVVTSPSAATPAGGPGDFKAPAPDDGTRTA